MRHFLLLLLSPLVVAAAPVPKETEKEKMKRLFGELADAKKGYDFTLDGDKLVLEMEANASPSFNEKTPPRIGREVKGDFEAQVTVTLPVRAGKGEGSRGIALAGLCVWATDGRYHTIGTCAKWKEGGWEFGSKSWDYLPDSANKWGGHIGRATSR